MSASDAVSGRVQRTPWLERTFRFDTPLGFYAESIERLRGTPARIADLVAGVPAAILTRRDGTHWSIQENVGHLLDLDESLFITRLDEYERGATELSAADLTNRRTEDARHNEAPIAQVLERFRRARGGLVARLDGIAPERFGHAALHPRLRVPMRLLDMVEFMAHHDDFHLATISELLRRPPV